MADFPHQAQRPDLHCAAGLFFALAPDGIRQRFARVLAAARQYPACNTVPAHAPERDVAVVQAQCAGLRCGPDSSFGPDAAGPWQAGFRRWTHDCRVVAMSPSHGDQDRFPMPNIDISATSLE